MYFNVDLEKKASPVVKSAVGKRKMPFYFFSKGTGNFLMQLDDFILSTEGYYLHIDQLDHNQLKGQLSAVNRVISQFDALDDHFAKINYGNRKELQEKIKYALQALYELESALHIRLTKDAPVQNTENYIKEGLSKLSTEAISKSLLKI